ncbi:MAG TPA: zinc-ribbon domain-containing protein [Polyangiaceae bacterium]|jgi:predicted Zn finger-like uncharacterized protein
MNVTCTGCPAKYSVPDEKVRGKKVRITCKHCGTNIVVDGTAIGAAEAADARAEAPTAMTSLAAPAPATATPVASASAAIKAAATPEATAQPKAAPAKAAAPETSWLVGFVDDHQEQHTTSELVELYDSRKIDDETLIWKDGMSDWLSPFDVPEVAAAMKQRGVARRAPSFALPAATDDEPTVVGRSPFDDETVVSSAPSEAEKQPQKSPAAPVVSPAAAAARKSSAEIRPSAVASPAPAMQAAAAKPAAARRAEKRPEVDLFGSVASAGGESDASLDFGVPDEPAQKMTGARNESSVLFSLDALTKPDPKANQKKAQDKEKEKDAAAVLFGDSSPNSLMNVGGGGLGGLGALAAPDFTKPVAIAPEPVVRPSDPVEVPNAAPAKKKGGALVIGAIVAIAAVAAAAFVFMSKKPAEKAPEAASADTKATSTQAAATPPAPATANDNAAAPAPTESAAPSAAASAVAKPGATAATAAAAAPGATAATKPTEKPAGDAKKPEAATPAPAPAGADFDKSAAIAALGAAAANAASCKKPDGPTGTGKASVTFAPSGRATNSTVTGAFAGTDVGGCVARIFRAAKVPAFGGDPVTVSKSFSIQ